MQSIIIIFLISLIFYILLHHKNYFKSLVLFLHLLPCYTFFYPQKLKIFKKYFFDIYKKFLKKKIKILFNNDIHNEVIGTLYNLHEYNLVIKSNSVIYDYFESICYDLIKESYVIKNDIEAFNNWLKIKDNILTLNDDVKNYITTFIEGEYEIEIK